MAVTDLEIFETITRVVASITGRRQETLYRDLPLISLHLDKSQVLRVRACLEEQFCLEQGILEPFFVLDFAAPFPLTIGDIENCVAELRNA